MLARTGSTTVHTYVFGGKVWAAVVENHSISQTYKICQGDADVQLMSLALCCLSTHGLSVCASAV